MSAAPRSAPGADPRVVRTHARVLEAAWEVLAEVGFDRVTIELISERSGVARSTMYRHWTTREEILRDAFSARAFQEPGSDGAAPDARAALSAYAVTFAAGLAHDWGRAALTMAAGALDEPDQRSAVRTFADGTLRDLRAIVERASTDGDLPAGADLDACAVALVDVLIAPLFYRYQVLGEPAGDAQAGALAHRAWQLVTTATPSTT
ncbi:MAG: TetR/AcrR family transcriptional regulator [Nocardioides sp.]|nr:TetR/AcrR family transcriptional regulator [Nocardioides sp.]